MSDIAIRAESLGKKYTIGHAAQRERYSTLRDVIAQGARNAARKTRDLLAGRPIVEGDELEELWVLRDVSFELRRGEVLGVIGRNGAGKSTLLKILSRITEPSSGRVTINGRVASLLEVGTGFHPELTGRENIFLNGAILGMNRLEIRRKFDEIVAFAEVEKFLDTPVKRYSSGMYLRLAFSVAAHLDPDILIVDEVLAVGDAAFQKKCLRKMEAVSRQEGRTVLMVSHNMTAIRHLCTCGAYLDRGRATIYPTAEACVVRYLQADTSTQGLPAEANRTGDGRIRFTGFFVENDDGERISVVPTGESCTLVFEYQNLGARRGEQIDVGFGLHAPTGERLLLLYSSHINQVFTDIHEAGQFRCRLPAVPLATGRYSVYPRIEINGNEADYPRDGVGWIDVDECNFLGTGKSMGSHGHAHAYFVTSGQWTERAVEPSASRHE